MAKVKVLIEGYAKKMGTGWKASSTVCLVTSNAGKKIITDPGCNRELLLEALKKEGLKTGDIDYVTMSHQHPDHAYLAGIFENAKAVTFDTGFMYDGDTLTEYDPYELGDDIEILQTPGHVLEHISLVATTDEGAIGIAGDTIFFLEDEEQVFRVDQKDHSEAPGLNMEKLIESRKLLVQKCDYIIPGHGKKFKVAK